MLIAANINYSSFMVVGTCSVMSRCVAYEFIFLICLYLNTLKIMTFLICNIIHTGVSDLIYIIVWTQYYEHSEMILFLILETDTKKEFQ